MSDRVLIVYPAQDFKDTLHTSITHYKVADDNQILAKLFVFVRDYLSLQNVFSTQMRNQSPTKDK